VRSFQAVRWEITHTRREIWAESGTRCFYRWTIVLFDVETATVILINAVCWGSGSNSPSNNGCCKGYPRNTTNLPGNIHQFKLYLYIKSPRIYGQLHVYMYMILILITYLCISNPHIIYDNINVIKYMYNHPEVDRIWKYQTYSQSSEFPGNVHILSTPGWLYTHVYICYMFN